MFVFTRRSLMAPKKPFSQNSEVLSLIYTWLPLEVHRDYFSKELVKGKKGKGHTCTGTEALYMPYGG